MPPPPPGGGAPPPPPGGYSAPGAPTPQQFSVSNAFNYAWKKYQENFGPWIVWTLVAILVIVILQAINWLVLSIATDPIRVEVVNGELVTGGGVAGWYWFVWIIMMVIIVIVEIILAAQFIRAALAITREGRIGFDVFTQGENLGSVVVGAILLGIAYFILLVIGLIPILGWIVAFVGSIVLAFFSQFFVYYILGENKSPMEGIQESWRFVNSNLASVIVLFLASILVIFIGAILCFVGLLVAYPVVIMAHAYTYKSLRGEPIAG